MAATIYTFSIAEDTLNGTVSASALFQQILDSAAIVTAAQSVSTDGDILSVEMKDDITAGYSWQGSWDSGASYSVNDAVVSGGEPYVCILGHSNQQPPNATYWTPLTGEIDGLCAVVAAHDGVGLGKSPTVFTTQVKAADGTPIFAARALRLGRESFKRTDDGTESMNVDGRAGGAPTVLWNGTGAGDTGGDWTAGGVGSETAGSAHSGTNGWDTGIAGADVNTVFDGGSMQDIGGSYDSLTFWLQPKAYPGGSRLRVSFLDSSNTRIGDALRVDDYTSNMDPDVWQQVSIPLADFSLTGNVQKLRFSYRNVAGQHHWLDDIELIPANGAGPFRFRLAPPSGEQWVMSMAVLKISGPQSGWDDDAFASVAGPLTNGLLFRQRRISTGEILWKFNTKDNDELGGYYHPQDDILWANGVRTLGFMVRPGKATVTVTDDDVLEFVVRDNLSGVTKMRAYLHYGVEVL